MAKDCKENRQLDMSGVADMTTEEAWAKLKQASDDRDLDDFREVFQEHPRWLKIANRNARPLTSTPRLPLRPHSSTSKRKCARRTSTSGPSLWYAFAEYALLANTNGTNWRLTLQEKQSFDVYSLIDLQGQMDREYVAGFYFSDKAPRKALQSRWPTSPEENLERLANAGFPLDRGVPKCHNCGGGSRRHQLDELPSLFLIVPC